MTEYAKTLILIDKSNFTVNQLVQIIELASDKLDINTISIMAKNENKSFNGIKNSNRYIKTNIGGQKLAVKGLSNKTI